MPHAAPDLVVIVGPPASGKATVGRAIAEATGYALFHNHLTAEPAAALFGWGTPAYLDAAERLRMVLFERALTAATPPPGIVFTFVWAFGEPDDNRFIAAVEALFAAHGRRVVYVELKAGLEARLAREGSADRIATKPVKADVASARRLQHEFAAAFRMNSGAGAGAGPGRGEPFLYPERHLVVDTERHGAAEAAALAIERFGLVRRPERGTTS